MVDSNTNDLPDDPQQALESLMLNLDPTKLGEMTPQQMSELLGGAKMADMMALVQKQARELAEHHGVDLDQLSDEDDDGWFDHEVDDEDDGEIPDAFFRRPAQPDGDFAEYPGAEELWQAAEQLPKEHRLEISVEMKSPPVTEVEKAFYETCHYRLLFDPHDSKVTFRDVTTPRQDYLQDKGWPAMLKLPKKSWPDLELLWDTIQVEQYNLRTALQSGQREPIPREDLIPFATQALRAI